MVSVLRPGQRHIMIPGIGVTTSRRAVQQPAPPAGMHVEDSFNGSNGTNLNGRTPDIANTPGNTWAAVKESWSIQSNCAFGTMYAFSILVIDCGTADGIITMPTMRGQHTNGIIFRYVDNDNYWRAVTSSVDGYAIIERTAGADATRASAANSDFTVLPMTVTLAGASIAVNWNGINLSYSSSVRATATKHGIYRGDWVDSGVADWWKMVG